MACEMGRVLQVLLETATGGERQTARSIASIATRAGLSEHDARAAVHDLQPTGVVVQQRKGRGASDGRWARGYELAPRAEVRGPGRRPRLVKLALLAEPSRACGDLMDVLLRQTGVLAVQATTGAQAVRLLDHIGFDLVVIDSALATEPPGVASLGRAMRSAACDHGVLLRRPDAPAVMSHQAAGCQVTLAKPFSVQEFKAVLKLGGRGAASCAATAGVKS
jgi:CheY-like chemotaxis protein